jgi:hypothetical protein
MGIASIAAGLLESGLTIEWNDKRLTMIRQALETEGGQPCQQRGEDFVNESAPELPLIGYLVFPSFAVRERSHWCTWRL